MIDWQRREGIDDDCLCDNWRSARSFLLTFSFSFCSFFRAFFEGPLSPSAAGAAAASPAAGCASFGLSGMDWAGLDSRAFWSAMLAEGVRDVGG